MAKNARTALSTTDLESDTLLVNDVAFLKDIYQGLADVEAGRVVPHDKALERLMAEKDVPSRSALREAVEEAERDVELGRWIEHAEVVVQLKRWAGDLRPE